MIPSHGTSPFRAPIRRLNGDVEEKVACSERALTSLTSRFCRDPSGQSPKRADGTFQKSRRPPPVLAKIPDLQANHAPAWMEKDHIASLRRGSCDPPSADEIASASTKNNVAPVPQWKQKLLEKRNSLEKAGIKHLHVQNKDTTDEPFWKQEIARRNLNQDEPLSNDNETNTEGDVLVKNFESSVFSSDPPEMSREAEEKPGDERISESSNLNCFLRMEGGDRRRSTTTATTRSVSSSEESCENPTAPVETNEGEEVQLQSAEVDENQHTDHFQEDESDHFEWDDMFDQSNSNSESDPDKDEEQTNEAPDCRRPKRRKARKYALPLCDTDDTTEGDEDILPPGVVPAAVPPLEFDDFSKDDFSATTDEENIFLADHYSRQRSVVKQATFSDECVPAKVAKEKKSKKSSQKEKKTTSSLVSKLEGEKKSGKKKKSESSICTSKTKKSSRKTKSRKDKTESSKKAETSQVKAMRNKKKHRSKKDDEESVMTTSTKISKKSKTIDEHAAKKKSKHKKSSRKGETSKPKKDSKNSQKEDRKISFFDEDASVKSLEESKHSKTKLPCEGSSKTSKLSEKLAKCKEKERKSSSTKSVKSSKSKKSKVSEKSSSRKKESISGEEK